MAKPISDFDTGGVQLEGERTKKDDLLGKKIEIIDWIELPSQNSPNETFLVIQGKADGKLVTFSSGVALKNQLIRVTKENLPVEGTLETRKGKNQRNYFILV